MLATVASATLIGVDGRSISVEAHVSNGLPGFSVVGLPDASCREARDRVRAAMLSSGLRWPQRRMTINLAPSGVRKGGACLDLPSRHCGPLNALLLGGSRSPGPVERVRVASGETTPSPPDPRSRRGTRRGLGRVLR
ncbi:MAG: magnesium chelatase domain-containing protein [Acidimicrobiales bacterium]